MALEKFKGRICNSTKYKVNTKFSIYKKSSGGYGTFQTGSI